VGARGVSRERCSTIFCCLLFKLCWVPGSGRRGSSGACTHEQQSTELGNTTTKQNEPPLLGRIVSFFPLHWYGHDTIPPHCSLVCFLERLNFGIVDSPTYFRPLKPLLQKPLESSKFLHHPCLSIPLLRHTHPPPTHTQTSELLPLAHIHIPRLPAAAVRRGVQGGLEEAGRRARARGGSGL